jgi:hypothetical protein
VDLGCVRGPVVFGETAVATTVEATVETAVETAIATTVEAAIATAVATAVETAIATAVETAIATTVERAVATAVERAIATAVERAIATAVGSGFRANLWSGVWIAVDRITRFDLAAVRAPDVMVVGGIEWRRPSSIEQRGPSAGNGNQECDGSQREGRETATRAKPPAAENRQFAI